MKFQKKTYSTLLPFLATKSNVASTSLPVASTLLLVCTGLRQMPTCCTNCCTVILFSQLSKTLCIWSLVQLQVAHWNEPLEFKCHTLPATTNTATQCNSMLISAVMDALIYDWSHTANCLSWPTISNSTTADWCLTRICSSAFPVLVDMYWSVLSVCSTCCTLHVCLLLHKCELCHLCNKELLTYLLTYSLLTVHCRP